MSCRRAKKLISLMKNECRILMVNYEFPPIGGGGGQAHYHLLREYAQMNQLRVDVLSSGVGKGMQIEDFSENIKIYRIGIHKKNLHYWRKSEVLEWLFKAKRQYKKLISQNRYGLVHAFFAFPSGWLCYKSAGLLPYIVSLRGSDVPGFNVRLGCDYKLLAGLFRRIWTGAAAVIANSEGLRQLAREFMPRLNIEVIPNGIDTERFYPAANRERAVGWKILTVGRLIARKRIDMLIDAMTQLKHMGIPARLSIAGEGNLTERLRHLARERQASDEVIFLGRVPAEEMPQVYREHDIFVSSSAHEGMSNAMLEAMASGLPIVSALCEGVQELIGDNGTIVNDADGGKIAEAIRTIIQDKQKHETMAAAARRRAELFSWQNVAQAYVEQYDKILTSSKSNSQGIRCAE